MEQVLTVSILDYFKRIHAIELTTSNALELLSTLKSLQQLHTSNKELFNIKQASGINYETISEIIQQDIHRIEQSHQLYTFKGNLITSLTKQYNIESKNKEYATSIDYNKIEAIVIKNTPKAKATAQEVYEELFINNVKNSKDNIIDNGRYLRDLKKIKQYAKATAKDKK